MKVTLEGEPQELMVFLTSLASTPELLKQITVEQGEPPVREEPPVEEQIEEPQVEEPQRSLVVPEKNVSPHKRKAKTFYLHPKNANPNSTKERIFRFIRDNPGVDLPAIRNHVGKDYEVVNPRVRELVQAGRVENRRAEGVRNGRYFCTPEALVDQPPAPTQIGFPDLERKRPGPPNKSTALKTQIITILKDRGPMPASRLRQYLKGAFSSNNLYARLAELTHDTQVARIAGSDGRFIYRALEARSAN